MKVHKVIDELFFEHQRSLLHFDFEKAAGSLREYEAALLSHMYDEEEVLLPAYSELGDIPNAGKAHLYYDDHTKMRSHVELFKHTTANLLTEAETDRTLLKLLDREAFYLRLCSHHDRREAEYLYPILDSVLTDKEIHALLDRVAIRREYAE